MPGRMRKGEVHLANLAGDAVGTTALTDGKILIGDATNVAAAQTLSGDVTVTRDGVTAIGSGKVLTGMLADNLLHVAEVSISAADLVATGAGKFGHANGYPLIAAPGATKVLQLVSAVLIYDYDTAAYTDGGNITLNWAGGGAALTGLVSAANSVGASADKIVAFYPLATAGVALTANLGINLVSSAAFTQPGTAAGVVRVKVNYRVFLHELA